MTLSTATGSTPQGGGKRRLTRLRTLAVSAALVGSLAALVPSSAVAVSGSGVILGPWSCGPDQTISMSFGVTGTGAAAKVILEPFRFTTKWSEPALDSIVLKPGHTNIQPAEIGRTINWFQYTTFGNAKLNSWTKNCN